MMKKKLFLLVAFTLGSLSVWAQEWTDYTSKITNPSFETGTALSNPKTDYSTTCEGWVVTPNSASNSQVGIVASGSTIQGIATSVDAAAGNQYFYIRNNWNPDTNYNISQTIASSSTLPAGFYKLTLKAMTYSGNWSTCAHTLSLQEGDNPASTKTLYSTGTTWTSFTVMVYKKSADTNLKISANLKAGSSGGGQHYQLLIDDVQLQYCVALGASESQPVDVTDYISNPGIQNTDKTYVPRGWSAGSRQVGNSNYTEGTGDTRLEAWSNGNMYFDYYQTLNGLADGKYKLYATCGDSNDKGGFLYATSNGVTKTTDMPATAAEISTTVNVVNNTLKIGMKSETTSGGSWMTGDNFRLEYLGDALDLTDWIDAKTAATTALGEYNETYATTERQAIIDKINAPDPTSASQMNTMVTELNQAVSTYRTKAANEVLVENKSALTTFINTTLPATYPNSSNDVLNTDISKWASSTYVVMEAAQHWSGINPYKYYEQSSAQWGQSSWSIAAEQSVNLPVGRYAFVVTARASAGVTSKMTVNGTEVALSNNGNTGYGIATDGEATYDMANTYANTIGRGWEYAYVEFELTEATDVTFKLESSTSSVHNWVSIANPVLYYNDAAKANMELVRKNAILATIATTLSTVPASDVMNVTVLSTLNEKKTAAENASTDNSVEELNTINSELVDAISAANTSINNYTTAKALIDAASSLDETGKASYASNETVSEVSSAYNNRNLVSVSDEQKTAMRAALVTAVKAQTSNNAVFTLALVNPSFEEGTSGWTNDRNTTGTYDYRTDETNPADGLKLLNVWAPQFNWSNVWQKVILPAGQYTLSAKARTNAEPLENKTQVRAYINYVMQSASNGLTYTADETAWNDGSKWISLSTTFSITEETEVELGIYSTGKNISGNSQGWFQVDDFQLVRNGAPTATMTIAEANKWATFYAPFDVDLPANVYSYAITVDEGVAVRSKLGGDDAYTLPANTPVLVYTDNAGGYSETFTADAATGTPAAKPASNYLVGTATAISAPASVTDEYTNYILQNYKDKDGLAWYKVNNNRLPANRAYLSVLASTDVKSIFDFTTAIESESIAVSSQPAALHNLAGQTVGKDYKGIVITNGKKYLNK